MLNSQSLTNTQSYAKCMRDVQTILFDGDFFEYSFLNLSVRAFIALAKLYAIKFRF